MELSYLLLSTLPYEGPWINGIVKNLDEALQYFLDKTSRIQKLSEKKMSNEELIQRALDDNWNDDYFSYWVQVWDGTKKISTYKFNTLTKALDKQKTL
jgi:hypothetical protein